jgi:hypothetical protein
MEEDLVVDMEAMVEAVIALVGMEVAMDSSNKVAIQEVVAVALAEDLVLEEVNGVSSKAHLGFRSNKVRHLEDLEHDSHSNLVVAMLLCPTTQWRDKVATASKELAMVNKDSTEWERLWD